MSQNTQPAPEVLTPFNREFKIAFDPWHPTGGDPGENAQTKAIFANPISRILFCCAKRGHIVSQHFHGDCLVIGAHLAKKKFAGGTKQVLTLHELKSALMRGKDMVWRGLWRDKGEAQQLHNFETMLAAINERIKFTYSFEI